MTDNAWSFLADSYTGQTSTNRSDRSFCAHVQEISFKRTDRPQKRFICEITGHSGLDFFTALKNEVSVPDWDLVASI